MQALWRDLRDAVRSLSANPGFTAAVVLILALGIGANATMFSVVNAVLLRPVPWPNPRRLVIIFEANPRQGISEIGPSTMNYKDWREQAQAFERMAAFQFAYFNLADSHAEPERVPGMHVSAGFFPLLEVQTALGRNFLPADEEPGRQRVVLLTNGFWRRRYGGDPAIVGRSVTIEGESYRVLGVLSEFPMFRVLNRALDIYTPLALPSTMLSREDHALNVYALLRPEVTVRRAQSEMAGIARRLAAAYPATNTDWTVHVLPLTEAFARRRRAMLQFLLAAAGFVLLIACANIASLTMARSISRHNDLAIRLALGAGRWRIIRKLLAESLILALAGGLLGAALASGAVSFLDRAIGTFQLNRMNGFRIDLTVLGLTVIISVAASVLFGLGPAIRSSRFDAGSAFSVRRDSGSLLVTGEVALATMLLIGAVFATRSTLHLLRMDRGLDPHNILTAQLWMPVSRYATGPAERHFVDAVLDRVRALPGVTGASVANYPPLGIIGTAFNFAIEGHAAPAPGEALMARFRVIDPDFFGTMHIPLVKGRVFQTSDSDETRGVAIVAEAFARRFFPHEDALGQRIPPRFPGGDAYWYPHSANLPLRIVGIVRDIHDVELAGDFPQLYLPYRQNSSRITHLLVRTNGPPLQWAAAVRGAVSAVDRDEPLSDAKTLEEVIGESFSTESAFGSLLSAAAILALALAASGIYGLLAWSVSRRTREIGIRMAIGAGPVNVVRMVLRQSWQPALAGVLLGSVGALALHGALGAQIVGAQAFDALAFLIPAAVLALVALLAGLAPALRAVRVNPISALRHEQG